MRKSNAIPFVLAGIAVAIVLAASMYWIDKDSDRIGISRMPVSTQRAAPTSPPAKAATSASAAPTRVSQNSTGTSSSGTEGGPEPDVALSAAIEGAWQSVERTDAKVANTIMLMTLFVGVIAVLLGLFEFFKLREIDRLHERIQDDLQALFDAKFVEINKQFERNLSRKLLTRIDLRTSEVADKNLQLEAIGHRTLLSYVQNDLNFGGEGSLSVAHMIKYIELERALNQLRVASEDDNFTGLSLINTISRHSGKITSMLLLEYLAIISEMRLLNSWQNQDLCNGIVATLEQTIGVSAAELRQMGTKEG